MEADNFFLKSNAYFKELREVRSIKEDPGKEVCDYPFSWQELRSGKLADIGRWQEWFEETGAQSFQGILINLKIRGSACLCIPAWIDRGGGFIHGGDYRTLPWVRDEGEDGGLCVKAEKFLEIHLQDFLDTGEWRQFFKLCAQMLEDLSLGEEWKKNIVCRRLSDQQAGLQERFYDTILQEDNSSRLYRNLFYRIEFAGKRASQEYENELRSQLQIFRQEQVQDALLREYIDRVKQMNRPPLVAVAGRDESWVREQIVPFWEEIMSGGRYFYNGAAARALPEQDDEKTWHRLFDKAGTDASEFKEKMEQVLNELQGSVQETKDMLERRVQETEARLQKMKKSLDKRNREIDRIVNRKNEWIIFLDSVSGGRYRLGIWQSRLAKKIEGFCEEQDLPVLGSNRNVQEIVGLYDSYIKKRLIALRKRNDIYNEHKEKNNQNKRKITVMETGLDSMCKMVEISMGRAERDSVDWKRLETVSPARLEEVLKDVCRKFQIRAAWMALHCYGKHEKDVGEREAAGDASGLIICDCEELLRRYYRGEQQIDSLDLLIILDADNIPVEDGILLGNFTKRMILLKGNRRWKGGGNNGIRRLLIPKLEIGEKQQEVYCRVETLWDMANEVLSG